ncbi:hypothetical protein HOLleu_14505 [Holothuria leucospilota]|uniref:Uncharacterized protein n=1 Tax=Holothuria leucospilota TaxID=206669 RepID=A0A9Q1C8P8_HOLLE|nr:hypothetical protein HOLleu_14505 [Holothuria leucospilota]
MRATKSVRCLREGPYPDTDRLRKLDLPCLRYRRLHCNMIYYMCKYLTGDMAGNAILFQKALDSYSRGHPLKIHKPRCNNSCKTKILYSVKHRRMELATIAHRYCFIVKRI